MPVITDPPHIAPPTDDQAEEYEEVTETRIVGITDTGVIRKRSFKRRVRKEDKSTRSYGHDHEEYEKIRKRVLESKMALEGMAGLNQRFKMIQMMHEDCMELVESWKKTRAERIRRDKREFYETIALGIFAAVCVAIFIYLWFF